ncbi:MAG: hypothetical protein PHQ75_03300 [Thermoguttaceae bacterium]|nr:hypothetical protein [Thermoguttaceae bacterium]
MMNKARQIMLRPNSTLLQVATLLCLATTAAWVWAADDNKDCLWGTSTEQTTYQKPYNPILAPNIPVVNLGQDGMSLLDAQAISPETAIKVVGSDGSCYSYYFKDIIEYRLKSEYQHLTGVLPAVVRPPLLYKTVVEKNGETRVVVEQSPPAVDTRYYDACKIRVKVMIPCAKTTPCIPAQTKVPAPVSFHEKANSAGVSTQIEAKP